MSQLADQRETPVPTLGRPRLHMRATDSTNDRARALAIAGAPHGTLVTASHQYAGRGRQGRRWSAPPGSSLLASLVLRSPPPLLPLIAAVAVCDVAGDRATIKWPNDVVLAGPNGLAKLAGILVEGRPQEGWAVLGIGLNVALDLEDLPEQLRATAATLGEPPEAIEPTLARLLSALARRLAQPADELLEAYRARDALRGRDIAWTSPPAPGTQAQGAQTQTPGATTQTQSAAGPEPGATERTEGPRRASGRAEGIDGEGRLVVALPGGGLTTLNAGEVHLLPGA